MKLGWFLIGAVSVCAAALAVGFAVLGGAHGFSAREQPGGLERWVAQHVWSQALPADAKSRPNPIQNSPEVLDEARAHWADHCAGCHANDGSGDTLMGKSMYPPAPDMRLAETQQKTDGALFFIIQNGIRLTGMPGWGGAPGHEQDSWKLVHFIRHLPQLSIDEKKQMEKLNPKSPDDLREEQEEEQFLNGDDTHEATPETPAEHHHH